MIERVFEAVQLVANRALLSTPQLVHKRANLVIQFLEKFFKLAVAELVYHVMYSGGYRNAKKVGERDSKYKSVNL